MSVRPLTFPYFHLLPYYLADRLLHGKLHMMLLVIGPQDRSVSDFFDSCDQEMIKIKNVVRIIIHFPKKYKGVSHMKMNRRWPSAPLGQHYYFPLTFLIATDSKYSSSRMKEKPAYEKMFSYSMFLCKVQKKTLKVSEQIFFYSSVFLCARQTIHYRLSSEIRFHRRTFMVLICCCISNEMNSTKNPQR